MALLRQISWPPSIVGIFLGLLQLPMYAMLSKTLNGSGGYSVISNWLLQQLYIPFDQDVTLSMTWWSVALLFGIVLGSFLSARMSKRKFQIYASFWQDMNDSLLKRIFLGLAGGFLIGLGLRLAGDGTSFEEFSAIAKMQFHSMITIAAIFGIGMLMAKRWYSLRR